MFEIGDIVELYAPQAGHKKYHVCILVGSDAAAWTFLYLNSNPDFEDTFAIDCSRVPCLPPSPTGKTVFAFAFIPRYSTRQLQLYRARKLGALDPVLAADVLAFAAHVDVMSKAEKSLVLDALAKIAGIEA